VFTLQHKQYSIYVPIVHLKNETKRWCCVFVVTRRVPVAACLFARPFISPCLFAYAPHLPLLRFANACVLNCKSESLLDMSLRHVTCGNACSRSRSRQKKPR
jgi:hypothetical protein